MLRENIVGKHTKEKWLAARKRKLAHSKGRFPAYHSPPGKQGEAPVKEDGPEEDGEHGYSIRR